MSDRRSRVAQIPYLNSVPYYMNWGSLESDSEGRWTSTVLPPRQLGMAMESGEADAGLLPVADLIRLGDSVVPLEVGLPPHHESKTARHTDPGPSVADRESEAARPDASSLGAANNGVLRLGIACRSRVDSVLLFIRDIAGGGRPLTGRRPSLTLTRSDLEALQGARIALTEESSTSVRLLRLLLEVRHGVTPSAYDRHSFSAASSEAASPATNSAASSVPSSPAAASSAPSSAAAANSVPSSPATASSAPSSAAAESSAGELASSDADWSVEIDGRFQAALVIGDQALRWRARPPEGFVQAMDLASEWCDWTGLPFVFACWSVRRDLDPPRARWLGQFLIASLDQADQDLSRLTTGLPAELGTTAVLADYLRNFIYRLGPEEVESMARFRELLQANDIACTAQ